MEDENVTHKPPMKLSNTQLKEFSALLGSAPVLTTESENNYTEIWQKLVESFAPADFMELLLIRQVQNETWKIMRYSRHQTAAIERRFRQSEEFQTRRRNEQLVKRNALAEQFAEKTGRPASEFSQLLRLENVVSSVLEEVDDILERAPSEFDHNHALEQGIVFEEQLDRLINSALRRRNDALEQLEIYRHGLGKRWRDISDGIIEMTEISEPAKQIVAPGLAPVDQEPLNQDLDNSSNDGNASQREDFPEAGNQADENGNSVRESA
jgi:hypothetical protein